MTILTLRVTQPSDFTSEVRDYHLQKNAASEILTALD
jgi:hypothetical protein